MEKSTDILKQIVEILPQNLRHIAIISPAGGCSQAELNAGIDFFKKLNLQVSLFAPKNGQNNEQYSYLADSIEERVKAFEQCFSDDSIDLIICSRGGYGCVQLIDKINWNLVKKRQEYKPLPIVGYSDITALHLAMLSYVDSDNSNIAIAGIMSNRLPLLVEERDIFSLNSWANVIKNIFNKNYNILEITDCDLNLNLTNNGAITDEVNLVMPLNLAVLASLCGTEFLTPKLFDNKVIILEDISEPLYKIDRYLQQLKLSGVFQNIRGVIVADFKDCGEYSDVVNLVCDIFSDKEYFLQLKFIASNLNFGHSFPSRSVIFNDKVSFKF
ncbi:LD-carboxypeptidase [Lentisphaerae bacterium WC36]|nr:LD-carboxypeptidase [Lentisphaerae bacterium WC36]